MFNLTLFPPSHVCSNHVSVLTSSNPSFWQVGQRNKGLGLIRYCIFHWNDVCVDTEINSVSWQQMDCALSYCLTMAFSSVMLYRVERLCLYFLWENGYCLCYSCVLTKPCSLKCIMHYFFLFLCVFCHLQLGFFCVFFLFISFLCSALENIIIRHILSYRLFCTKQHLCMHVVVRTIMWPQNSLLWYMYVNTSVEHCSPLCLLAYAE